MAAIALELCRAQLPIAHHLPAASLSTSRSSNIASIVLMALSSGRGHAALGIADGADSPMRAGRLPYDLGSDLDEGRHAMVVTVERIHAGAGARAR